MIEIIQGDITKLRVDAIVNAANSALKCGGGVDGAVHRAAGLELQTYNDTLGGCDTGQSKLAPGFKLPSEWVIHTVGPVWQGGHSGEPDLLESCYRTSFEIALDKNCRQIAFPAISTGIYGYPLEQATRIALSVMREYEEQFEKIIACCFSESDREVYEQILTEISSED